MSSFMFKEREIDYDKGIYSKLDAKDIVDRMQHVLPNGWYVTTRGTLRNVISDGGGNWNSPWLHQKQAPGLKCSLWHHFMFNAYRWFVPSKCQDCWKVVVRPQSLDALFALVKLQKELDMPSKCGVEVRETVHGLYGGYFYNRGLESGHKCYGAVREAVNDTERLGPDTAVILKRA